MRILHIAPTYYPARGGAETYLAELSERLVVAGHDVTIATTNAAHFEHFWNPAAPTVKTMAEEYKGVRIQRFKVKHLPLMPLSYHAWRRVLWVTSKIPLIPTTVMRWWSRLTPYVPELRPWLNRTAAEFDLIIGINIAYEGLLAAGQTAARHHGIPFAVCPLTHLGAAAQPGRDKLSAFYTMRHQRALVCQSDLLIAMTTGEQRFYEAQGLPAGQSVVASPAITPAEIGGGEGKRWRAANPTAAEFVVTVLGTMSLDKGTAHVLQAAEQLWATGERFTLVLAGKVTDEIRPWLAQYAERPWLLIQPNISDQDKRDLLAATDLFVLPSRVESFGIVYLEAWFYAKPVIGAQTWGVRDVITDGEDGFLVPFGDTEQLATVWQRLRHNPAECARLGANGRAKLMQQYNWTQSATLVEQAYMQLVGGS